jgi:PAS domain-containing protein
VTTYDPSHNHKSTPLMATISEWVAVAVGAITIGGAAVRGGKIIVDRRKADGDRRRDENKRRQERDEFIDKLPDTLSSLTLAVAEIGSIGTKLSQIGDTVTRLEGNQMEAKELRRIQTELDDVASYRCDAQGRCYEVSPALCKMFGLTHDELLDNNGAGWTGALDKPNETWAVWQDCVKNNLPYEASYKLKNGIDAKSKAWPIKGVNGEVQSFYGIVYRDMKPGAISDLPGGPTNGGTL